MKFQVLAAVAALAIAACGETPEESAATGETMSDAEIGAQMEEAVRPQPGQYRTQTELIDLTLPDIPGMDSDQLRRMMEGNIERETLQCITEDQAERGYEEMLRETQDSACQMERFAADGNRIEARMVCDGDQGRGVMTMTGTATETSSDMTMAMTTSVPQMGDMAMRMRMISERVGDCPA